MGTPERRTRPPLPPPSDAEWLAASDGTRLYFAIAPARAPTREAVWLVSGAEARAGMPYPKLAAALAEVGLATVLFHPRGTGFSDGLRGDERDYAAFLDDHHRFAAHLFERFDRVFLLGQSAGCAFALEVAAAPPRPLAGIVLACPAWRLQNAAGMTPGLGDYLRFAWNYVAHPSALTVDMNSKPEAVPFGPDREEGLAMQRDPLVVRHFSMRYLTAQRRVMDRIPANLGRVGAPLLLIRGAHDALVDPASFDVLLRAAASADKQVLVAAEGGHGSSAVETETDAIVGWLRAHR